MDTEKSLVWNLELGQQDPHAFVRKVMSDYNTMPMSERPEVVRISRIGIGDVIIDRLQEAGLPMVGFYP